MTYRWCGIKSEDVPEIWPQVSMLVVKGLEQSRYEWSVEDIHTALLNKDMQLWIMGDGRELKAICITMLGKYPQFTVCTIFLMAGEGLEHITPLTTSVIEPWAQERGARFLQAYVRKGLERAMKAEGWNVQYLLMSKEIGQ